MGSISTGISLNMNEPLVAGSPPAANDILDESSNFIVDESSNNLITES